MSLTRVSPALFATSNNITSVTVGGSANTISLTFDGSGVITSATNNAVSVANTAITGNIISSQITSVANTQITGNIISSQITSNPILYGNVSVVGTASIGASDAIMTIGDNRRTVSTSTTTGAIVSGGGLGVWSDAYIGGNLSVAGGQIKFPGTQSASSDGNTLDDYEEGSWSPSVGGNATYNAQEGQYIKIGQLVFIFFDIGINVLGTGSTTTFSGVPFTAANIPNQSSAWTLNPHYFANIANGITWLSAYVPENATTISFVGNSTSATTVQMNGGAVFANGARIVGSGTYRASA